MKPANEKKTNTQNKTKNLKVKKKKRIKGVEMRLER